MLRSSGVPNVYVPVVEETFPVATGTFVIRGKVQRDRYLLIIFLRIADLSLFLPSGVEINNQPVLVLLVDLASEVNLDVVLHSVYLRIIDARLLFKLIPWCLGDDSDRA